MIVNPDYRSSSSRRHNSGKLEPQIMMIFSWVGQDMAKRLSPSLCIDHKGRISGELCRQPELA